ncbi:MAG TPA: response regulator [Gaiellaceae bacterium]|nr:response regulator [Gaiellaceae bacterium]
MDDDDFNRMLLCKRVEQEGHRTATADNGREALEMLDDGSFDVVLLDVLMPELDGYETLERIEKDETLRHIPVIMISSLDEAESVIRCIELGAEDYLPKPFDPVLLRARLNASLTKKRLHDLELEYIEQVGHVVEAAAAVEAGTFDPATLDEVARRNDALGQLARVFGRMAEEVRAREQRLREEVHQLRIEIDEAHAERQVAELTETDYFRDLERKVDELRLRPETDS